jgi:hypothetical protein
MPQEKSQFERLSQQFSRLIQKPKLVQKDIEHILPPTISPADELTLYTLAFHTAFPLSQGKKASNFPQNQSDILQRLHFISSVVQVASLRRVGLREEEDLHTSANALRETVDPVTTFLHASAQMKQAQDRQEYRAYAQTLTNVAKRVQEVTNGAVQIQQLSTTDTPLLQSIPELSMSDADATRAFRSVLTEEGIALIEQQMQFKKLEQKVTVNDLQLLVTQKLTQLLDRTAGKGITAGQSEKKVLWLFCTAHDQVDFTKLSPNAHEILEKVATWQEWVTERIGELSPLSDDERKSLESFLQRTAQVPTLGGIALGTTLNASLLGALLYKSYFQAFADETHMPNTFSVEQTDVFTKESQLPNENFAFAVNMHKLRMGLFDFLIRFNAFSGKDEHEKLNVLTKATMSVLLHHLENNSNQLTTQEAEKLQQNLLDLGIAKVGVMRNLIQEATDALGTMSLIRVGKREQPLIYEAQLPQQGIYKEVLGENPKIEYYSADAGQSDIRTHFTVMSDTIRHPIHGSLLITENPLSGLEVKAEIWDAIDLRQRAPALFTYLTMIATTTFADMSQRAMDLKAPKTIEDTREQPASGVTNEESTPLRRRTPEFIPVIRARYVKADTENLDTDSIVMAYKGKTPVIAHTRAFRGSDTLYGLDLALKQAKATYGETSEQAVGAKEALVKAIKDTYKATQKAFDAAPDVTKAKLMAAAIEHPETGLPVIPITFVAAGERKTRNKSEPIIRRTVKPKHTALESLVIKAEQKLLAEESK